MSMTACTKWVTVPPPTTEVTADGAFANDASAEATVAGLYGQIMSGTMLFLNGANTLYPGLSADELSGTFPDATGDAFAHHALTADNSAINFDLWGRAYGYLYQTNACLAGIHNPAAISDAVRKRLEGETRFMRALTLFYLTNLYGEVPLPLSTDYAVNERLPRADTGTIYNQMVTDLATAKAELREAGVMADAVRPSYYACAALMARVALYRKDWTEATAEADTVIESGAYSLQDLPNVFTAGNGEAIFSLAPVIPSLNTAEGLYFVPYDPTALPLYALTDSLLAHFETGDGRKAAWTGSNTVDGTVYTYPYKYKTKSGNAVVENYVVLRLAELYLIRAEARAASGDLAGATDDVNAIRGRAGLPLLGEGLSQADLSARVRQENRIEFFCEWGHRWLDLKRTGTADAVLRYKSGWQPTDVLYPIPNSQILLNGALTQNPGY